MLGIKVGIYMPLYFFVLIENAFLENWAPILNIANAFFSLKDHKSN
jgi:hypothetical protein